MKKIAMFTMGTRGDVQPYIFLSRGLIRHGYEVTLGSHPCWRQLVEDAGIKFAPIGPDIDIEKEAAIIRGKNPNPVMSMMKTMNFVFKIIQDSSREIYEVCKGMDFIVVSHSQMGATEAEVLGIPTVNVTLQKEMIPEALKPKNFMEKVTSAIISRQVAKPYNKIRKIYNLKPVKTADAIMSKDLNMIPISKYVLERNPYWEEKNKLTGYWYEEDKDYVPDERLDAFLCEGEAPVIVALGAMSFEDQPEEEKLAMFVEALSETGHRAIIQGFEKSLEHYELPDTMIACGSIPHSWLFSHAKYVMHHCGFGTASATMIYGIPSIPVPHVLDQMGFATQLTQIGVATQPIKCSELSKEFIKQAIEEMDSTYEDKKERALDISAKIKEENGVETAVRMIEEVMEKYA